jgi:Aerotolerance regulator N-terminal
VFTLANPLGLLALLGLPVILAIHFLQRKAIELPVATLFLLERTHRDVQSGRRLDRLIPSIPLWLQLLAILLLAWFLAEPRYQKSGSFQRVAIVLDSSASMSVFKEEAIRRLASALPKLQGPASALELTVIESAPGRPRLYAGSSITDFLKQLESWQPLDGLCDPSQALRLARSLVSNEGSVIYLTDTPTDSLPFEAKLFAIGSAVDNVGFTGVSFTTDQNTFLWRAIVRNYGATAVDRTWSLQTASGSSSPQPLHLAANAIVTLQAAFPIGAQNVQLVLSPDRFTLDDRLPIVAPKPKTLMIDRSDTTVPKSLTDKILRALDHAEEAKNAAAADLSVVTYDPLVSVFPSGSRIVFIAESAQSGAYLKGGIVSEAHPLMENLNWQSLLIRETSIIKPLPTDRTLLWQDKKPLIFLRTSADGQQLCFDFDVSHSNAESQPAFIVLLHRFAESIRKAKIAPSWCNLETGQAFVISAEPAIPIDLTATDLNGKPIAIAAGTSHTPKLPCFLTVAQKGAVRLTAAVQFSDTREADFTACSSSFPDSLVNPSTLEQHTRADPLWRVWLLILLPALLISWKFTGASCRPSVFVKQSNHELSHS